MISYPLRSPITITLNRTIPGDESNFLSLSASFPPLGGPEPPKNTGLLTYSTPLFLVSFPFYFVF